MSKQTHEWRGLGAAPGLAAGRARVIRSEKDLEAAGAEDIIVARHATPSLFPHLLRARAAVCETGGLLCHLAVLARELGKPCVTGVRGIADGLEPGAWLSVDGASGVVKSLAAELHPPPAAAAAPPPPSEGFIPILRYGLFTGAFEYAGPRFDIETAVRTAALISLPGAFECGPPWDFIIEESRVLVEAGALRRFVEELTARLESGSLKAADLRREYDGLCPPAEWSGLWHPRPGPGALRDALGRYVTLNQITWAASVLKEPLTRLYRDFLFERLAGVEEARRQSLFLDSLITTARSYILRCNLTEQPEGGVWSPPPSVGAEAREEMSAEARALTGDARGRHLSALGELEGRLSAAEFERCVAYVRAVADLVDLTERKNTDLHRCGQALFADAARREAVAQLFDPALQDRIGRATGEERRRIVELVMGAADARRVGRAAGGLNGSRAAGGI